MNKDFGNGYDGYTDRDKDYKGRDESFYDEKNVGLNEPDEVLKPVKKVSMCRGDVYRKYYSCGI